MIQKLSWLDGSQNAIEWDVATSQRQYYLEISDIQLKKIFENEMQARALKNTGKYRMTDGNNIALMSNNIQILGISSQFCIAVQGCSILGNCKQPTVKLGFIAFQKDCA